jgi:DGQHR domain-containing protein
VAKKKKPVSQQDLLKRDHFRRIRALFQLSGFNRINDLTDKPFHFQGSDCDFDEFFIKDNLVVLVECTITASDIPAHVKKKKIPFDKILDHPSAFISYMIDTFPPFASACDPIYDPSQYRVVIAYASRFAISDITKAEVPRLKYLDYNIIRYLELVAQTIRLSARYELFEFLGIDADEVGELVLQPNASPAEAFNGSVLPESHSNFGPGYKVVSCYMSPEALLNRAYVLRRDGWRAGSGFYQRMVQKKKVTAIRRYLRSEKRVFVNNIIATLPSGVVIVDGSNNQIDINQLKKTLPARIQIPQRQNCIGIIDGQHRLYAYHEGGAGESDISLLRKRQNLLIKGIVFPPNLAEEERLRFQANLFLEINSTQTTAKADLRHEIELILHPFSPAAIAKRIINKLNEGHGPLSDEFELRFYDKDKLKTTSVVSFQLVHLVRIKGPDSLFQKWSHPDKEDLGAGKNDALLSEYIQFCTSEINKFMSAVKSAIPPERWTADRKVPNRFLTTTYINGCLACLRGIVRDGALMEKMEYDGRLKGLASFNFSTFRSSQYNALGRELYKKFFG